MLTRIRPPEIRIARVASIVGKGKLLRGERADLLRTGEAVLERRIRRGRDHLGDRLCAGQKIRLPGDSLPVVLDLRATRHERRGGDQDDGSNEHAEANDAKHGVPIDARGLVARGTVHEEVHRPD